MTNYQHLPSLTSAVGLERPQSLDGSLVVGVLNGEGVGPQLTNLCVDLLGALSERFGHSFDIRFGGPIGLEAMRAGGDVLSEEVRAFCAEIFASGGAILAGPGGGRFVYDMRRWFNLYLKLNPLERYPELEGDTPVRWRSQVPVDVVVVRENLGGLYQGRSEMHEEEAGPRVEHSFGYAENDVARLVDAAARLAAKRRGHLTVVAKDAGLPDLTRLWFTCAHRSARRYGIELRTLDIDYAVYAFMSAPEEFDVVAVPNCFGDILADLGGVICGSRGLTFGGSYSETGAAVYQTNHGSAYDLAGTDTANPVGQILSLAMMLRESYGLHRESDAVVDAVRQTWREGWRTADLMAPGRRLTGTADFADRVIEGLSEPAATAASA
jgi:3-isopropylmalate dehydrogenase